MARILEVTEEQYIDITISNKKKRKITMCAGYIAVMHCYGLRGNEGMWVDTDRLRRGFRVGEIPSRNEISHILFRCWEGSRERTWIECMCFV